MYLPQATADISRQVRVHSRDSYVDGEDLLVAVGMNVRGAPVESSLARRSVTAVDICSEGAYLVEDGTKATEQARQLRMAHVVPGVE